MSRYSATHRSSLLNALPQTVSLMRTHILAFRPDPTEPGAWIADLACGHTQHVRHQPPFQERPWVLTPEGRARFIGAGVDCPERHPAMDTQEGESPAVW